MLLRPLMLVAVGWFLAVECLPQPENDARELLRQADHLSGLFNWADAGPLYAQAEKLFIAAGDQRNALYAKFGAIRGSMETLNLPETSEYLSSQLQTSSVQRDLRLRLMCLIVKGDIDGEIDSAPARADWEEGGEVAKKLSDSKWESRASAELGFHQFLQGEIGPARKAVGAALIRAHLTGDVGAEIRYLAAIGNALALNRLDDQAISYLNRAIDLAKKHPDSGYPFVPVAGKIQALVNEKEYNQALALIEESELQARSKHKEIKLAQILLLKADVALGRQHRTEALNILNETAQLTRRSHSRLFGDSEMKLAEVYSEQHQFKKAAEAAELAVAATGQSRDLYLAPGRLRSLAELELALGNVERASELYHRATDTIEGILVHAPDRSAKLAVLTEMSPVFSGHFKLAAELNRPSLGFEIIEQVRGRIVAESLMQPAVREVTDTRAEDAIRRLKVQLVRTDGAKQRRALLDELFFAEQARWTGISDHSFHTVDPVAEITLPQVQRQLRKGEIILEYVLGDTGSFCLKITGSTSAIVKLAPRKKIELLAESYLSRLEAGKEVPEDSRELFEALIQPVNLAPTETSILIVPDGVLHLIPFAALRQPSGAYMVSNHTIWYLPSAGALPLLGRLQRRQAARMLLAVGGVQYDDSPGSFLLSQVKRTLYRAHHESTNSMWIPNLPGTEEEIRAAVDALGTPDARLIVGRRGTKTEFKSAPLNQFRILHLAVHGEANTKNPDRAALVFRPDPPADDGLLESREVLSLQLNADLVVLSACDTAVGHLQGEEGVANLSRAFLVAGARSVISTLWSIDDTYSLFLMKHFYVHLRDGASEAEALRLSQTDLLGKFGEDTPAVNWAAFTLLGDGSRILFTPRREASSQ